MRNAECGVRNERQYGLTLFSLPILCLLLFSCPAWATLIDRVVASVNNQVITLSELNQAVAFNALVGREKREKIRSETLEGLINRRLLMQEASRLKFVEISEQDVDGEIEKLKKRLGSEKNFADFMREADISREQLARMFRERLLVERFIEKKIGLFIRVTRDEAQAFYDRNAERFKGQSFQQVQKEILAGLQGQKLDQQIEKYIKELKSKADIRIQP
jgi:peptidyl-prolyl cis-trans isomerase SurA